MPKKTLGVVAIIIVLISASIYFFSNRQKSSPQEAITNFEECARAGYTVGESYPRQCWTPDKKHFVEKIIE